MSTLNSFIVKYFLEDKVILDTNVEHWNEYVTALKASDKVTIRGDVYNINGINMVHNTGNGLVIELHVDVSKNRKTRITEKPDYL